MNPPARILIEAINRSVNAEISYADDKTQYGRADKWVRPGMIQVDGQRPLGDCEDYALEKRHRIMQTRRFNPMNVIILLCLTRQGLREGHTLDHAVLGVHDEGQWLILDNRHAPIWKIGATEYVRDHWWFPEIWTDDDGSERWLIDGAWTRMEVS